MGLGGGVWLAFVLGGGESGSFPFLHPHYSLKNKKKNKKIRSQNDPELSRVPYILYMSWEHLFLLFPPLLNTFPIAVIYVIRCIIYTYSKSHSLGTNTNALPDSKNSKNYSVVTGLSSLLKSSSSTFGQSISITWMLFFFFHSSYSS